MPIIPLSQLKIGQSGQVQAIDCQEAVCNRIMEMGLTPGTTVEVVRFAPMGDPIDIKIRGYHLSLRKHEAETVQVLIKE